MNLLDYLTHSHNKTFLIFATVFIVIWTIEMRLATTYTSRLKQNPQTMEERMNNLAKFAANRSRDTAYLVILFPTLLMGMFHTAGIKDKLETLYPMMLANDRTLYASLIVGALYVIGFGILKPPSLVSKHRVRYLIWMIYTYIMFIILGWIPVTVY